MINHYKSDAVTRDIVLKSAAFGLVAGLAVVLPIAINMVAVSMFAGCYERSDYVQAIAILPAIHMLVFVIVMVFMCAMYAVLRDNPAPK